MLLLGFGRASGLLGEHLIRKGRQEETKHKMEFSLYTVCYPPGDYDFLTSIAR